MSFDPHTPLETHVMITPESGVKHHPVRPEIITKSLPESGVGLKATNSGKINAWKCNIRDE